MKVLSTMLAALPLMASLLSGCVTINTSPASRVDTQPFLDLIENAPCTDGANRLFVIDKRYVYWDRGPGCQDQVQRLYGDSVDRLLCVQAMSPAGPYTNCSDPTVRSLFDIILANRQAGDLGLGAGHVVARQDVPAQENVIVPFKTIAMEAFSAIHTRRTVVVRDAETWATVWAEHNAERTPVPPLPQVDFSQYMLVGVFAGDSRGCREFAIRRVVATGRRLAVDYEDRDITPTTICLSAITNPMHIVAVPRLSGRVDFKQIAPERIDFTTIARSAYSRIEEPINVVIRDAASWTALWNRHSGGTEPVPAVNFNTSMVIGVFRGILPNGCYSTVIADYYRADGTLNAARIDTEPGPGAFCTLAIVTPVHLIAVPQSDQRVVFPVERRSLP